MDRHIKNEGVHDRLGKRVYDQSWVGRDAEKEYVLEEGQWCPRGLTEGSVLEKWRIRRLEV